MITNRILGIYKIHIICQLIICLMLYAAVFAGLSLFVYEGEFFAFGPYTIYFGLVALSLWVEALARPHRFRWLAELSPFNIRRVTSRQMIAVVLGLTIFLALTHDARISRLFMVIFVLGCLPVFGLTNRYLPRLITKFLLRSLRKVDIVTLVVGDLRYAHMLQHRIQRGTFPGILLAGYLDETDGRISGDEPAYLGKPEEFQDVVEKYEVRQVIISAFAHSAEFIRNALDFCQANGARALLINDLPELIGRRLISSSLQDLDTFVPRTEPLEDPLNRYAKRVLDIAVSLFVLCTVFPVMTALVWLAHRFQSPGPLFFRQLRTGLSGKPFLIFKYRTLHCAGHREDQQVCENDARVFNAGRLIRKLSIDEIPQFINVLRGEMSVVGPRPHIPEHDELFNLSSYAYKVRNYVKPGITGLAQVNGFRGETKTRADIRNRVRLDLFYLERWTVWLDLGIIFKTCWEVLNPSKQAY